MLKASIALWAVIFLILVAALWTVALQSFNAAKIESPERAMNLLFIPFIAQIVWFGGVVAYSKRHNRKEPIAGTLAGLALEVAVLIVIVLISATAHF